jgi:tetratricopeptide (TPR) repeat protein
MSLDPEIIRKAAQAVARMAERTAKRGHEQVGQKGEGWEMSHDLVPRPIYCPLLREAEALYAEAIHINATGWYHWQRALLLMELGDFDQAASAFQACVDCGDYVGQPVADQQIGICRQLKAAANNPRDTNDSRAQIVMQTTAEMFRSLGPQGKLMTALFSEMMTQAERARDRTDAIPGNDTGCETPTRAPLSETESSAVCEFGEDFAWHLVRGDWEGAHAVLNKKLRRQFSPDDLRDKYVDMTEYAEAAFTDVEAQPPDNDMPDMEGNDVALVYIAIFSDDACEAVTLMVCREDGELRVRDVEWGRP